MKTINVLTTNFEEIYEVYMANLDPDMGKEERVACMNGFVAGMMAGVGILQNRISETAYKLKKLPPQERAKGFQYIAQVCAESATDLEKLQMQIRGTPYGSA